MLLYRKMQLGPKLMHAYSVNFLIVKAKGCFKKPQERRRRQKEDEAFGDAGYIVDKNRRKMRLDNKGMKCEERILILIDEH